MERIAALFLAFLLTPLAPLHAAERKPNVVCVLADDLGWSDPSVHLG